jgi:hypothetical protein
MAGQARYSDPAKLARALKVIRTWAEFDLEEGRPTALYPADVIKLVDKALAEWTGEEE